MTFSPGALTWKAKISLTGKRREIPRCRGMVIQFRGDESERKETFRMWSDVAMRIVAKNGVGFRMIALACLMDERFTGKVSGTNLDLAAMGGGCSTKTISREIGQYEALGLFIGTRSRKKKPDGRFVEIRTLRLSVPAVFDPEIRISEDTRGPA